MFDPVRSHTFKKIDREIISTVILLSLIEIYKQMYVHRELVNCLVKLAQEKSVVRRTECLHLTLAVNWGLIF